MISRRFPTFIAMAVWAAVALTAAPGALSHHHTTSIAVAAESTGASCADLRPQFDHHPAVYQSEDRTITKSEAPILRVQADSNGGIYVEGWDKDTYSVTLCKAAEAGSDADAILSKIHLSLNDGILHISTPGGGDRWAAHLLIRTPKSSALDLQAHNGPMTLTHVDGNLKIRAENGPVNVNNCTGELDLASHNGPVTLEDNSGKQNVRVENGPITLSLAGNAWDGAGLEATSRNGPVTLAVPSGYKSGVVLQSEGHSPFECSASVCSEGRKTWDDDHKRVEFGAGPTVVRVSTVNGPVSVR
jgi:Putative adhesin